MIVVKRFKIQRILLPLFQESYRFKFRQQNRELHMTRTQVLGKDEPRSIIGSTQYYNHSILGSFFTSISVRTKSNSVVDTFSHSA